MSPGLVDNFRRRALQGASQGKGGGNLNPKKEHHPRRRGFKSNLSAPPSLGWKKRVKVVKETKGRAGEANFLFKQKKKGRGGNGADNGTLHTGGCWEGSAKRWATPYLGGTEGVFLKASSLVEKRKDKRTVDRANYPSKK